MVEFEIKAGDFQKFLKTVSCKGVLQFKSKGKVESYLFSSFFIDVDKSNSTISVLTLDTYFNQIKQHSTIKAKVIKEGVIEITDNKAFIGILDSYDSNEPIKVTSDESKIMIKNQEGDEYERRIIASEALNTIYEKKGTLFEWLRGHSLIRDEGTELWLFTTTQGSTTYPMRIKTTKESLSKFVKDTIKLTKENSTVITVLDGQIKVHTGAPNATNRSRHPLKYNDIGKEIINFSVKFSALQSIVPNLLDDVILNFRKTGADTIILRIESQDKNMKQILSIGSQDKDGILWDESDEFEAEEEKTE